MKIFHTAKRQVSTKRWLRLVELHAYCLVPVWVTGLKDQWKICFQPLVPRITALWRNSGRVFTVAYLKEAVRIMVLWTARLPYAPQPKGVRVARSRSGLPLILPARLRYLIVTSRHRDSTLGWVALRVALTILSVYRVIGCPPNLKIETITSPFDGSTDTLPIWEVRQSVSRLGVTLKGLKPASPWLFSEAAGPNYPRATWSSGLDALAFWCAPLQWWHYSVIAVRSRSWLVYFWLLGVMLLSVPVVPILVILGCMPTKLGRLSKLYEAAGKVRVVAITDWWTQVILHPLHQAIFDQLKLIRMDATFDQTGGLKRLLEISRGRGMYSFDLSAATDRLPVATQEQILSILGLSWAGSWRSLLTKRPWYLGRNPLMYAVGQPMGAYSSWAMLALTHHVIVQVAASRVGWSVVFPFYCVLGDDVVIADTKVAEAYRSLMTALGVPINMSKSLVSEKGVLEFAKRWVHPDRGEFSPIGPGLILVVIRNLRFIPLLVNELVAKSFGFLPMQMKDVISLLSILRRKTKIDKQVVTLLAMGPSGGLWGSGQLADRSAAWIAAYHSSVGPDLLNLYVFHAICAYTIVQAHRAVDTVSAALKELRANWLAYPIIGRSLAMAVLSTPLMLVSPGLWVTHRLLDAGVNISVSWRPKGPAAEGLDPFAWDEHAARNQAMRDVTQTYIGSVSALNWTDRAKVLDLFAAQNFLIKEVERLCKEGLDLGGGDLVPWQPGGALSERSDGSA
jgi:hypothetical protein